MATRGGKSNTKPLFKLTKLEAALGTSLPLSADGKPLVVGICRTTPYGTFWTVKVVPTKHGRVVRGGPDDGTYTDFPILQTLIPRCFCVWENPKDGSYTTVIHALPKFGAFSPGDTDEAGATSSSFDSSLLSHPDLATIRAEEKANGHTVVYRIFRDLLVGGTKACHYAFLVEPIETLAMRVGGVKDTFPTPKVYDAFMVMANLLASGRVTPDLLTAKTLVGERETNEHLRYYSDPFIVFFDQDLPPSVPKPVILTDTLTLEDLSDPRQVLRLRSGSNHEGWVLAGLSSDGTTLWRLKLKSISYTVERSLRELFREGDGLETTLLKCHRVMLQRNLSFLHVSLAYMETVVFGNFLTPLIEYMFAKGITKEDISHATDSDGFACVIQAFREESGCSDDFCPTEGLSEEDIKATSILLGDLNERLATLASKRIVVATSRFLPGVGKSTWFEAASSLLGFSKFQAISQDDFGGNKGAFVKGLQEILGTKSALVARTNFGPQDRKTLIDGSRHRPLLFLEPDASEDPVLVAYCALKGLVEERPDHPTLGSTGLAKRLSILGNFYAQSKPVRFWEVEGHDHVEALGLPILDTSACLDPAIYAQVKDFLAMFKGNKRWLDLPPTFDALAFGSRISSGPELRVPPSVLAARIQERVQAFLGRSSTPVLYVSVDMIDHGGKASPAYKALEASGLLSPKATQVSADHITLVFGPTDGQVKALTHLEGMMATSYGSKIFVAADGSIAALAVVDPTYLVGSHAHTLPVASGVPHLTLAWDPSKRQAKDSAALIAGTLLSDAPTIVELSTPLHLSGVITFHHTLCP